MKIGMPFAPGELELQLTSAGNPESAVWVIDLDSWQDASIDAITRGASAIDSSLRVAVGVLRSEATPNLMPLVRATALTFTTNPRNDGHREIVRCRDIAANVECVRIAVEANPQASVALARLLRQTSTSDVEAALAAEAAVYSMLLGGNEFADWRAGRPLRPVTTHRDQMVQIDRDGDVLSIVLNNPERRNALSIRLREGLLEAFRLAEADPSVERVDLSGAGPAFCSGGDLDEFGVATDLVAAYLVRLERAPWRIIDRLRDRTFACVHGACIGAGIEMAAFAGRVVAAPDAFFQLPEIGMGLVPGAGGTVSVPRRIGRWRAAWMMLTGERIDADRALTWGLVDAVAPELPS